MMHLDYLMMYTHEQTHVGLSDEPPICKLIWVIIDERAKAPQGEGRYSVE